MLELQDICYQVTEDSQDIDILRDVSLKIDDEFTVITGPNGGGKSTMAKIITGIPRPAGFCWTARTLRSCPSRSAPERESASRSSSRSVSRG